MSTPRKILFISDLDGTLLDLDARLSDESRRLLFSAINRGALFSVATARTPSTVSEILQDIPAPLPYIVMTGAALWNPDNGKYSDIDTLSVEDARKVTEVLLSHHLPCFIYCLKNNVIDIYHTTGELSDRELKFVDERLTNGFKRFHLSAEDGIPEPLTDTVLFYAMGEERKIRPVFNLLKESGCCNPVMYFDIYNPGEALLEVFSVDASKANAALRMKHDTGADTLVVFGDNLNDIPMMRVADLSFAVKNALPQVKDVADYVIGPNYENSVAYTIYDITTNGF